VVVFRVALLDLGGPKELCVRWGRDPPLKETLTWAYSDLLAVDTQHTRQYSLGGSSYMASCYKYCSSLLLNHYAGGMMHGSTVSH